MTMRIDWEDTINRIFAESLTCPRCERDQSMLVTGYSRRPQLSAWAPRHQECPRGPDCDARKLITLCEECAREELLRGNPANGEDLLDAYLLDCRRDLEEALDYLAEYWRDEVDLSPDQIDARMEEVEPDAFREETAWRDRLEQEYLRYHQEFRRLHRRIPQPGWRAEFAEELIALGYTTQLGD